MREDVPVKPSPFTYHRPAELAEAVGLLAGVAGDGKVLAGGQSLLPILSMRLAAPGHVIDINRLPGLGGVRAEPGGVRVGALARHAAVERDETAAAVQPLLRQALRLVAHPTIRNRGTTVGSLAHADPSGELTAVLALTGGTVTAESTAGRREIPAAAFFTGALECSLRSDEIAVEAFFPAFDAGTGTAFVEVARRHGDYAVCGVAAAVGPAGARAAYISMSVVPVVLELPPAAGDPGDPGAWREAGEKAADELEPEADLHASAAYRRQLGRVLTARALAAAALAVPA